MDRDDDDGVGFIAESHYLKSPTVAEQQAMALLQIPGRDGREGSISSNVSDLDVPIYSSENLTTSSRRPIHSCIIFSIVLPCDAIQEEAEKFVKTCYYLEDHFGEDACEREELTKLANYAKNFIPRFTGAGLFTVNKKSLFALIGTTTTYMIVVLQFSQTEERKIRNFRLRDEPMGLNSSIL